MTTTLQKFSVAAFGAAALAVGSVAPAQAFELTFNLEGETGSAYSHYFPEYQNARFTGFFTIDSDAPDLEPGTPGLGKFSINNFFIEIVNDCFPEFRATLTPGASTTAFVILDEFINPYNDADVDNSSTNDPTKADFQLYFDDFSFLSEADSPPTRSPDPDTFLTSKNHTLVSFLTLKGSASAPNLTIPVSRATITGPTEAIPEPTTMAGLTVFGLGAYLKRRADKSRKQK